MKVSNILTSVFAISAFVAINFCVTELTLFQSIHRDRLIPDYPLLSGFTSWSEFQGFILHNARAFEYAGWALALVASVVLIYTGTRYVGILLSFAALFLALRLLAVVQKGSHYLL